jgi:myo-inositol-hexaphosphate 3-phosphohydrolase
MLAVGAPAVPAAGDAVIDAPAVVETTPSDATAFDSVDDPAIWVDPVDPTRSVVIGADHGDKGLSVYDLSGTRIFELELSSANNVDLRTGFTLGGATVPILGLAGSGDVSFYTLDPVTRHMANVTPGGKIRGSSLTQPGDGSFTPHGICLYHSPVTQVFYAFVVDRYGTIKQFELTDGGNGNVALKQVRHIDVQPRGTVGGDPNDALEGCVADEVGHSLFVGEQDWSIWRYGAEPTDPGGTADRVIVDQDVSEGGHFARDVEGLTVVNEPGGGGYLIASSQGDHTFTVYRTSPPYEFVRKVDVVDSATADGCERTDGVDAVAADLGPAFPRGLFVCQDNANTEPAAGSQNFKFVRLETFLPLGPARPDTGSEPEPQPSPPAHAGPAPEPEPGVEPAPMAPASRSGYWMVGARGKVYAFGDARPYGDADIGPSATAVDIEPTPSGQGYWVIDDRGGVHPRGDAVDYGSPAAGHLGQGEAVTSLSATRTGRGYRIFTSTGRVLPFGDATHLGDLAGTRLNGPVLDSVTTASGNGYYMVAADGGIFAFGDARFFGSMGGTRLNQPVRSLVPDTDGTGYWLVAADGGVFAFSARFRGSLGDRRLNRPVTGMVPFGAGYLMVGEDGGIFNFSDRPFSGSLGASPPADPVTSVAALG